MSNDLTNLRAFAQAVFGAWPDGGMCLDGGDLQELGLRYGLLTERTATEPCGEHCVCRDYGEFPQQCLSKTSLLAGDEPTATGLKHAKLILRLRIDDEQQLYTQAVRCLQAEPSGLTDSDGDIDLARCLLVLAARHDFDGCDIRYSLVHLE